MTGTAPEEPGGRQKVDPGGKSSRGSLAAIKTRSTMTPFTPWLLYAGIGTALVALFLPFATASSDDASVSAPINTGTRLVLLLMLAVSFGLAWATFNRPKTELPTRIALSFLVGCLAVDLIYEWSTWDSDIEGARAEDTDAILSPAFGILAYTTAISFVAVCIVFLWISRSKVQSRVY